MAVFGGRVDNDFDMNVLNAYLAQFFDLEIFRGQKKLSGVVSVPDSNAI